MVTGASSHILSSPTALCVFIVGTLHNLFISLNLPFLVSFLFPFNQSATLCSSLSTLSQFLVLPSYPLLQWVPLLLAKKESILPAPLKARIPLVLHKVGLMRSLGALLCPYETPGTLLVCSFLKCPMAKPLHPLTPRYFLGKKVSLISLKSQTLERFLISRLGGDFERWFPSFSILSLGRSKASPFGWIRSILTRSSWVVWSTPVS